MAKRKKNQGRHYQIDEWVDMEIDSYLEGEAQEGRGDLRELESHVEHTEELYAAHEKFTEEANRVVQGWMEKHPDRAAGLATSDDVESEHDIAWNTWADIVGHGVGFWEHMTRDDYASLERAIQTDKALQAAQAELQEQIYIVGDNAVVSSGKGRDENPRKMTKAQFEEYFAEEVLPMVAAQYERDGIPDKPARREAWNDTVDMYIQNGLLPQKAGDWSHPRWLETRRVEIPRGYNPTNTKKLKSKLLR